MMSTKQPSDIASAEGLVIGLSFPRQAYSGGELGEPEPIPSPARVHAAFLSAAAGGPYAQADGKLLCASERHLRAVRWLEEQEPIGIAVPAFRESAYDAVRYRERVGIDPKTGAKHKNGTSFEPFTALAQDLEYLWPDPGEEILDALGELAPEVTHVGRADCVVVVHVRRGRLNQHQRRMLSRARGRGPGIALRVPTPGRLDAFLDAHRVQHGHGSHSAGRKSRQALDEQPEGIGDVATQLARFADERHVGVWPYDRVIDVPYSGRLPSWVPGSSRPVYLASAIHRAVVAAIGEDVPAFVTGRSGQGPLLGPGHLAIQFAVLQPGERHRLLLGVPRNVPDADLATLLSALESRPSVRLGRSAHIRLNVPREIHEADSFWPSPSSLLRNECPIALEATGRPRKGRWSLDDAVLCSVGYAFRGVLEESGVEWGVGWGFRQELVNTLRSMAVDARAQRINGPAAPFYYRSRPGDLAVAVDAVVDLGDLQGGGRGFIALGRSRHVGGGLLRPVRPGRD